MFAKLFETDIGQILVKADSNEDSKPEIRYYFEPENLGVCSIAFSFDDTDSGWESQEKAFTLIDQDQAYTIVKNTLDNLNL